MASGLIKAKDIDEKFLQCPICMDQLTEPKILPCLHRYCGHCLAGTVTKRDKEITCPTCREVHDLPPNGVNSLKTDFNTKNIIEFIQSEHADKHKAEKDRPSRDAPKCHSHPGKALELYCTTCGNQPICVTCMIGSHKGHDLQEVSTLAKVERDRLTKKTEELMKYRRKIYDRQEEVKTVKRKLQRNANAKRDELQEEFDNTEIKLRREIRSMDEALEQRKREVEEDLRKEAAPRRKQLEDEIKAAQEKCDQFCIREKQKIDSEQDKLQREVDKDKKGLREELESINKGIKQLLSSLQEQETENSQRIGKLSDHFDDIVQRFEDLTGTSSSILAGSHDWTDIQGVPTICTEMDLLIEAMKREFPELSTLIQVSVGGLSPECHRGATVSLAEKAEAVVAMESVETGKNWEIRSITGSKDGSVVVTGKASKYQSLVTVINTNGRRSKRYLIASKSMYGCRYAESLTESKIASVCWCNDLGVLDTGSGSHKKIDISSNVSSWPANRFVSCVAVDRGTNQILVGGRLSRDVHVFDAGLKHLETFMLPEAVGWPWSMAVHGDNLLVCGGGTSAHAVSLKSQSPCSVAFEFAKPPIGHNCTPFSVCTDRAGYVYMLWTGKFSARKSIVVQYSRDGPQILQTRVVECEDHAECITIVVTDHGEELLIATHETGKLIRYRLKKI